MTASVFMTHPRGHIKKRSSSRGRTEPNMVTGAEDKKTNRKQKPISKAKQAVHKNNHYNNNRCLPQIYAYKKERIKIKYTNISKHHRVQEAKLFWAWREGKQNGWES